MILGCGALNVDLLYAADVLVTDGESFCRPVGAWPGGSAANTVHALAKLGLPCRFAGAVGEDEEGGLLLGSFVSAGVDTSAVVVKQGLHTGRVLGFVDRLGRRALYVFPGANLEVTLQEMQQAMTPDVNWVHCSSFAGDAPFIAQRDFVAGLPEHVRFSFAPGALYARRGVEELRPFLKRCEVLFLALPELETLTGEADPLQGAGRLLNKNVNIIAVTLGSEGSLVVTPAGHDYQQALERPVVDTTGAGDAFAAGFIFGCLQGFPLADTHRFAAVLASFAVESWGARDGLPTLSKAKKHYERVYRMTLPTGG